MNLRSRRNFLSAIGTAAVGASVAPRLTAGSPLSFLESLDLRSSPADTAKDEKFWARIRTGFDLPPGILNLDNGYCNPLSRTVMDDLVNTARSIEQLPAKRLETVYEDVTKKFTVPGVARMLGVPAEEIALTRNATEALDTVILGLPMKAGDEIVCSTHDYYAMLDAIEQRRLRDGIVVKMIKPPIPAASLDDLVDLYEKAIGNRTKLVLITHASNLTGQIYPVKQIAAAAHRAGAEVLVDGAQTFALLDYKISDLDCDYYGISLHKWLMAPVGSGVLWMRKEHEPKIWPMVPPPAFVKGMHRFQWSGTYPEFISAAAATAIKFHETLGTGRKEAR
ncbi:MAG: aminotransferase class V-fold PLP-dependent enzyme, partial [Pyrinomonadaceae bacterium]